MFKAVAISILCAAICAACDDPREPPSTGRLSEEVQCLDQERICAGMPAAAIDQWIAGGGAVRLESARCGYDDNVDRWPARSAAEVLARCNQGSVIAVAGRRVDYAFDISDATIATIKIERRTGAFP
jgi:hypothetical protein